MRNTQPQSVQAQRGRPPGGAGKCVTCRKKMRVCGPGCERWPGQQPATSATALGMQPVGPAPAPSDSSVLSTRRSRVPRNLHDEAPEHSELRLQLRGKRRKLTTGQVRACHRRAARDRPEDELIPHRTCPQDGKAAGGQQDSEGPAVDATRAARKLYTCLKKHDKLQGSEMAELPRDAAVSTCAKLLLSFREQLVGRRGGRLKPTIIAIALARLVGCGASTAVIARAIDPTFERHANEVKIVQDRILASSHLWQELPNWDSGVMVDGAAMGGNHESFGSFADVSANVRTCQPCSGNVCTRCRQPPLTDESYWHGYSAIDLNCMPTCESRAQR